MIDGESLSSYDRIREAARAVADDPSMIVDVQTVIDEALVQNIMDAVELGMHPTTAARMLGVPPSTFRKWLEIGEEDLSQEKYQTMHAQLAAGIYISDSKSQAHYLKIIRRESDAKDAINFLESRWGGQFGKRAEVPKQESQAERNDTLNRLRNRLSTFKEQKKGGEDV